MGSLALHIPVITAYLPAVVSISLRTRIHLGIPNVMLTLLGMPPVSRRSLTLCAKRFAQVWLLVL